MGRDKMQSGDGSNMADGGIDEMLDKYKTYSVALRKA